MYGALVKRAFFWIWKRWYISRITSQNVQRMKIFAILVSFLWGNLNVYSFILLLQTLVMQILVMHLVLKVISLQSEIFRTLRIRVGCTHARTTQNHNSAFLWSPRKAILKCIVLIVWSQFVLGWVQQNSNFGSSDCRLTKFYDGLENRTATDIIPSRQFWDRRRWKSGLSIVIWDCGRWKSGPCLLGCGTLDLVSQCFLCRNPVHSIFHSRSKETTSHLKYLFLVALEIW